MCIIDKSGANLDSDRPKMVSMFRRVFFWAYLF